MREHSKRWLISVMKTSGSKRRRVLNGRYADERQAKRAYGSDDLPQHESFKSTRQLVNGKINYGLLVRFLRGQIGNDWDDVYAEIISRIPTKLLDYREMIFWFVADKVEFVEGKPWNKKTHKWIWTGGLFGPVIMGYKWESPQFIEFYVHPETNKLIHIPQIAWKRAQRKT